MRAPRPGDGHPAAGRDAGPQGLLRRAGLRRRRVRSSALGDLERRRVGCWHDPDERDADHLETSGLRLPPGPVDLADIAHRRHPRLRRRQGRRQGGAGRARRPSWPTCRSGSAPAARPAGSARAAGAPGHGHLRQGRGAARTPSAWSTRRACGSPPSRRPPTRRRSTTSSGGSARRCPRAGHIGVFDRSHYEDVLIVRVRELAPPEEIERRYDAINEFEARAGRRRHHDRQVHAAHLAPTSRRSGCSRGWTTRRSTGSSTPATSTSGRGGPTTGRPTRSRWSAPTPRSRPGTSIPATRSGTATSRRPAAARDPARHGPAVAAPPTSTSRPSSARCSRTRRRSRDPDASP